MKTMRNIEAEWCGLGKTVEMVIKICVGFTYGSDTPINIGVVSHI